MFTCGNQIFVPKVCTYIKSSHTFRHGTVISYSEPFCKIKYDYLLYGRPVWTKMEQSDWISERSESPRPDQIFFKTIFSHYHKKHLIDQASLVRIGRSGRGDIGRILFVFLWSSHTALPIQTQKSTRPISPFSKITLVNIEFRAL
jgi:hypothetical protein